MSTQIRNLCWDCKTTLVIDPNYAYCPECVAKHKAAWKETHTRQPGDTRPGWLIGDACRFIYRKVEYQARIVDMSDASRRDSGNYDLVKLELTKTVRGLDGKPITQTWIHPEPVQSYKLKKPLLK
jgi:hypothetical protein